MSFINRGRGANGEKMPHAYRHKGSAAKSGWIGCCWMMKNKNKKQNKIKNQPNARLLFDRVGALIGVSIQGF